MVEQTIQDQKIVIDNTATGGSASTNYLDSSKPNFREPSTPDEIDAYLKYTGERKKIAPTPIPPDGGAPPAVAIPQVTTTSDITTDGSTVLQGGHTSYNANLVTLPTQDQYNAVDIANGTTPGVTNVRTSAISQSAMNYQTGYDWRVKLSLVKTADYLYGASSPGDILYPLKATGGIIFPYTPSIQVSYKANYESSDVTHSNYRLFFYKNSGVDDINITCDFTAQDTSEANYVLAVIHFLKSVTKMFYGKDIAPAAGTPPPLCYLSGLGQYQFNNHPLVVSSFQYSLPTDVDYIRAGSSTLYAGVNLGLNKPKPNSAPSTILARLTGAGLNRGAMSTDPQFTTLSTAEASYVPTKIEMQNSLHPIISRNDIRNKFSLQKYATGALTKTGIW